QRVVRANLRTDAVLERRDDLAACGVVLRIRGEHHQQVEFEANRVALNLDVAFMQNVEQADLNLAGQIRQFVDGKDAAVGARQQTVLHGQFVGEVHPGLGGFDGI